MELKDNNIDSINNKGIGSKMEFSENLDTISPSAINTQTQIF
jgi:hypothetical protein